MMFEQKQQSQRKARLAWGLVRLGTKQLLVFVGFSREWEYLGVAEYVHDGTGLDGKKGEKVEMFQLPA